MLYEDLIKSVEHVSNTPVLDVRVSPVWTGVKTRNVGISLLYAISHEGVEDAGSLTGKPAKELLNYLLTFNLTKVSIGLATLNSLLERPKSYELINALDYIESRCENKRVVFVGHFEGLDRIKTKAKELIILERKPQEGDVIDTAYYYLIPDADIVAITGSAFANKSIESILSLKRNGETIILGPSTPPSQVLFDYGVDVIGASLVQEGDSLLSVISQGGSKSQFKPYLNYIMLRK